MPRSSTTTRPSEHGPTRRRSHRTGPLGIGRAGPPSPARPVEVRSADAGRRSLDDLMRGDDEPDPDALADEIGDELGEIIVGRRRPDARGPGRARRVPRRPAAAQGRVRQLPQAHGQGRGRDPRAGLRGPGGELLPVLDACDAAVVHDATDVGPISKMLLETLQKQGLEAMVVEGQAVRSAACTRRCCTSRARAARASSPRACARATSGRVACCARHGQGQGLTDRRPRPIGADQNRRAGRWRHSANGSRRTTTRRSASPTARPRRRSPRRTASWPASCTPTPTPTMPRAEDRFKEVSAAYDVVGDEAKRKEYDEVRELGPMGGMGGGPGGPGSARLRGRAGRRRRLQLQLATDINDLLGGLFGRGGRGATPAPARRAGPVPSAATTSRPSCTCRSSTPSTGSRRRSTSCPRRPARPATAAGPSRAPRRRRARAATAGACSTTTRASSRSARRAPSAAGGAR